MPLTGLGHGGVDVFSRFYQPDKNTKVCLVLKVGADPRPPQPPAAAPACISNIPVTARAGVGLQGGPGHAWSHWDPLRTAKRKEEEAKEVST